MAISRFGCSRRDSLSGLRLKNGQEILHPKEIRLPKGISMKIFARTPPPHKEALTLRSLHMSVWQKKKPINRKHINIFLTALVGQSFQGRTPHLSQAKQDKMAIYCGIKQRKAGLSQGRVPFCPGEGSHLSQGRFPFVPDTVPPKMFMLIGFFLPECLLSTQNTGKFREKLKGNN